MRIHHRNSPELPPQSRINIVGLRFRTISGFVIDFDLPDLNPVCYADLICPCSFQTQIWSAAAAQGKRHRVVKSRIIGMSTIRNMRQTWNTWRLSVGELWFVECKFASQHGSVCRPSLNVTLTHRMQ